MNTFHDHNDTALIGLLQKGDKSAFETIYRKYAGNVYTYVRKNIQSKEDCEEIVQDIFTSLWIQHTRMEIKSGFAPYLIGIARYKIIHYFRRNALLKKYQSHFALFEAVYCRFEDPEINHSAIQAILEKIIKELPERCQEALKLRLAEDLSNRDIAKRMNISTRTVEVYMFRAFNHIRDSYKRYINAGLTSSEIIIIELCCLHYYLQH